MPNMISLASPVIDAASVYEGTVSYKVGKMAFTVDRIFKKDGADSVGAILIKLIASESDTPIEYSIV